MGVTAGEVLFARYAYPPNELGYCGPADPGPLLAAAGGSGRDVRARAQEFDGAWVYLQILASATGLDPLDRRVVEAYWVGNALLDAVDPDVFAEVARTRFAGESGADWGVLDVAGPTRAVPHHSFQVFTVYPWVRLLGRGPTPLQVLDRCRIRAGEVIGVDGDEVTVRSRPLRFEDGALSQAEPVCERARLAVAGRSLLGAVSAGDRVALHWDWVCDTLDDAQAAALAARTADQLELTNRAGVLGARSRAVVTPTRRPCGR